MSSIEQYIEKNEKWTEGLKKIRSVLLETDLEEHLKWGAPVYSIKGKNVLSLAAFKNHMGIWFFNGVFLEDKLGLLTQSESSKAKAMRKMRFENKADIDLKIVKHYVMEAISNQKLGKELKPEKNKTFIIPPELHTFFFKNPSVEEAYNSLSPGKQREYADYISEAKREETKASRIQKISPMIKEGKGLNDKYKNC